MRCSPILLPRDMVVVADIVCVVCVEGLVRYMAVGVLIVAVSEPIIPLQAILIVVEPHRLLLKGPQLFNEPFDAILPHLGLVPFVELGEGQDDIIAH